MLVTILAVIIGNAMIAGYSYAQDLNMIKEDSLLRWIPMIGIIMIYSGFSSGLETILFNNQGEFIPSDCRSSGGAVIGVLANIFLFLVAKNMPLLKLHIGISGLFSIFLLCMCGFFVFVWVFVPETYGLSLDEIEALFMNEPERR